MHISCAYYKQFRAQNNKILNSIHQNTTKPKELECGPMPNVMVTLPNIGGALCSTPHSLADAYYLTAVQ